MPPRPSSPPPSAPPRPRARPRDLGIVIGRLPPGPTDSIVDVPNVRVGHQTQGRDGHVVPGLPVERTLELLSAAGRVTA